MEINSRTGITLTNPKEILGRLKEYGEELFFPKNDNESEIQAIDFNKLDKEPSPILSEVERTIRDLHSGKAVKRLHMLCINVWDIGIWPHEWKQQELVILYKNGNKECGNY